LHLKRLIITSVIGFLILAVSACTSTQFANVFAGYAQQMQGARGALFAGDYQRAQSLVTKAEPGQNNYTLSLLEKARLSFLAQDWQQSRQDFAKVIEALDAEAAKAKVQLSRGLANAGALVSNDNAIAYEVPAYEQSMVHSYQALNYVYLGQLDSALVEIRRANLVQEQALQQNQQSLQDSEEKFNKNALNQAYPSMAAMIGQLKNGFQNAYTFYLSGVLYEAAGQANDAYIDYKRALEIYPDNRYLQQDVLRLATQLGMSDDLSQFSAKYGAWQTPDDRNFGELVILHEQGVVNAKQDLRVDLPIFSSRNQPRFFSFSLPIYQGALMKYSPTSITVAEQTYQTQAITRLQSLASKSLQDQLPALVTRQALRVVAKEQLRRKLGQEGGEIGNILAALYNVTSEQADTRSWSTLPDEVAIIRLPLSAGQHQIQLNVAGQAQTIDLNINAKRITLLQMTTIGQTRSHHIKNL